MSAPVVSGTVRVLGSASLAFALAFAAACSVWALRDHYAVPYADDWRILDNLFSTPLLKWLFTDQVGHRIPMTLLLLYVDHTYLSGDMHLLVAAALACAWIAAGALAVAFRAEPGASSPADRAAYAFCVYCLFWAGSTFDFFWGANQGSQQTLMLFAVALAALAVYRSRLRGDIPQPDSRLPIFSAAATVLATFSHGMGAASWAGIGLASVVARLRWRLVAALGATAAMSVFLYGRGLEHVPYGTLWIYLRFLRRQTLRIAEFWLSFIGCPVAHVVGALGGFERTRYFTIGMVGGAIGLAFLVPYAIYLWRRREPAGPVEMLSLGLMGLPLAGGVLVSVNRFMFPATAVAERFIAWTTLFWMGVACGIAHLVRNRAWGNGLAIVLLWLAALSTLPVLGRTSALHTSKRQMLARETAMHLSGVRWDRLARLGIKDDPLAIYRVVERMRQERRGFFSGGRGELAGSRLVDRYTPVPAARCDGAIDSVQPVEARDGTAAMVSGRLWDRDRDLPPAFVLLTDTNGFIRGIGEVTPGVAAADGEKRGSWVGFIQGFRDSERYVVHGVLADEHAVCAGGVVSSARS